MKTLYFKWVFLVLCTPCLSQTFYINKLDTGGNYLTEVDIDTFEEGGLYICPFINGPEGPEFDFTDVAADSNYIYLVSDQGGLYRRLINDEDSCEFLVSFNVGMNSLVTGDGFVYAAGFQAGQGYIYKYDLNSGEKSIMGDLPEDILPAGDLFFYENRLFCTAQEGDFGPRTLYEINMQNPAESCLHLDLGIDVWGAFVIDYDSYAKVYLVQYFADANMKVRELNMDTGTIGSNLHTYDIFVMGAATSYLKTATDATCGIAGIQDDYRDGIYLTIGNPVNSHIVVNTNIPNSDITGIVLYDMQGKQVQAYNNLSNMSVEGVAAGIYVIQANMTNGRSLTQKIIIR